METDNPFEPPRASLDVVIERGPAPAVVKYAVRLLFLSAALIVPVAIFTSDSFGTFAASMVSAGVLVFFASRISKGRNWARWLFALLTGLGTAMFLFFLATYIPIGAPAVPRWLTAFNSLQSVLQLAAVVLTCLPASSEWFAAGR